MRLRTLLAASFALLAMGLALAASLLVQQIATTRLAARIGGDLAQTAGQVRNSMEASLSERLFDMQVLASIARLSKQPVGSRRDWVDVMKKVYPIYAWIGYTGKAGIVEASTGGLLEGVDVSHRPWFRRGISAPFFGDIHEAAVLASLLKPDTAGQLLRFVDVAAPLQDQAGTIIGVVGAHLSESWIGEITREAMATAQRSKPDLQVLILAGDGTILLAPTELKGTALAATFVDDLHQDRLTDGLHRMVAGPSDRHYLAGISHSAERLDRPSLGWTVIILQPAEIALAASRRLSREILLGGTLLAVVAAMIGWWLAGLIARPLDRLSKAALAIDRTGDLPDPAGFREVRYLTASINGLLQRLALRDASLEAANRDLETRVAARTRDLETERSRAEEAGRAKADFLATMSHELRTPLTGMLAVHNLLRSDPLASDEHRRLIDLAQEAGASLLVIVNDILDVSKMDAGQLAIEDMPYDLAHLVEGCRRIAQQSAGGSAVEVSVSIAPDLPRRLMGDPTRMRQVVLNLATNAVKFTSRGHVVIAVSRGAGTVRVEVRDTGIGIEAAILPMLFQRFSQADMSTARQFGGTGLGLAICKRLIELMDGVLGVESRVGHGSTFWFELPLCEPASGSLSDGPMVPSAPTASAGRRLLLVEDNATNGEILALVLRGLGHDVVLATSADQAISLTRSGRFDAVLMDVQMPGKDGLAATREIREFEKAEARRPTPIIALTANAMKSEVERCRAAGMDAHVAKPVDWAALAQTLDQMCGTDVADADRIAAAHPTADPVMDEAVLETLAEFIGEERIGGLLLAFRRETDNRLSILGGDRATVRDLDAAAHILVAMSGQLGFREMAAFCGQLEGRVAAGDLSRRKTELHEIASRAMSAAASSRFAA